MERTFLFIGDKIILNREFELSKYIGEVWDIQMPDMVWVYFKEIDDVRCYFRGDLKIIKEEEKCI